MEPDALIAELAGAVLDRTSVDWAAVASRADDDDRRLIEQLKVVAAVADVHRRAPLLAPSLSPDDVLRTVDIPAPPETDGRGVKDFSGETVGSYRLIERLGRGGMGEVYLGERVDGRFEQRVAVKLVKRGMDSGEMLRRFSRERRILARLEHPGIARLLDGGETADGRPYFVMERVEGERITEYCRTRGLSLEDRLSLVASCCDAVDAAHRSLVVHRDLKPSNILVTAGGQVKLLDFGIAKLLEPDDGDTQLTGENGRILTAAYAAPEQIVGGPITVATDVFALGVVLYEILTNALPYDRRAGTAHELAGRVERETAERPSAKAQHTGTPGTRVTPERWARRLLGDVDTITMKALAHDPARRYATAAALAADLRRYLTSRPVEARPDSRAYRLRKFVVRHRVGAAASAIVATTIVAALAVSLTMTAAARRQAERAAAAQAFLTSLFEQIDPDRYVGSAPTVRDILEHGSARLERDLARQPELRADMEALLGQVFDQLSLSTQGEASWRRAVDTRQKLFGPNDPRTLKAKKGLAISLARQARYGEAEPIFEQLVAQEEAIGDRRELGSVLVNYGNAKRLAGDYAGGEALLTRSLTLLEGLGDPASRSLAAALTNLGLAYWQDGRPQDAAQLLERALAIVMKQPGPQSSLVAYRKKDLSHVYRELGDLDKAERYAQEALGVAEKLFPPHHPFIAMALLSLGQTAQKRGDRDTARQFYERSITSGEGSPPGDTGLALALNALGALLQEQGQGREAIALYERGLAVRRKALGDRHRDVADSWRDVGRARLAIGDVTGALDALRTSVDTVRGTVPVDSRQLANALFLLGNALRLNARPAEGLPYLEEAAAIRAKTSAMHAGDLPELDSALAAARVSVESTRVVSARRN